MINKGYKLAVSVMGHDKGRLYAVLDRNETTVLLADGKRRKLSSPKRKNIKHVIFLSEDSCGIRTEQTTDAALRRLLAVQRNRRLNKVKAETGQGGTNIG